MPTCSRALDRGETSLASFSWEDLFRLFQWPDGCFEQFTSSNYGTLVSLEALSRRNDEAAADPEQILTAHQMALKGYRRLLTHRRQDGAFAMFPGRRSDLRATLVAIRHLALYDRLFEGLGRPWLESALRWLENKTLPPRELLYLALSLQDAGRTPLELESLLKIEPKSLYERALLANCLIEESSSSPRESANSVAGDAPTPPLRTAEEESPAARRRQAQLDEQLDALETALPSLRSAIVDEAGLMGSSGWELSTEILSLATTALYGAGRHEASHRFHYALLSRWGRSWGGSQGTLLAVRALSRVPPPPSLESEREEPFAVQLAAKGMSKERRVAAPGDERVAIERDLSKLKSLDVDIALGIESDVARVFQFGCRYRVSRPVPRPDAPYEITCRLARSMVVGTAETLSVTVRRVKPTQSTQTLIRVGLPGGCIVQPKEMATCAEREELSHWELSEGYLDIYVRGGARDRYDFRIPVLPVVHGTFTGRPSMVYPYYDAALEAYAAPLQAKIIHTFGTKL